MKTIYTFLTAAFILLAAHTSSAQIRTIDYFNKGGIKLLSAVGAYYVEHTETNGSGGGIKTRFLKADNTKVSLYSYSSFEGDTTEEILDGTYSLWHSNGKLSEKGNYRNDSLDGKVNTWFESGQLSYEKFYVKGKLQDTLKGYYEDGTVRRIEIYQEGEMIKGNVFSKKGENLSYFPAFVMPEFLGGENAMIAYVSSNLKYPKEALEVGLSGLVLVDFIVEKDGSIKSIEVIKSISDDLDAEAIRVVRKMPRWKPGLNEGNLVPVRFILPVRFSIKG
ncbi:TonB family protein [Pontibacter sp. H259]|uniref:TonB family protein n=1 Tax=Pontibacter sp. H259 TaxID=3133421 RepID=UPI0030C416A6